MRNSLKKHIDDVCNSVIQYVNENLILKSSTDPAINKYLSEDDKTIWRGFEDTDVILLSSPPANIKDLPMSTNLAYVRVADQLYYADKQKNLCRQLQVHKDDLDHFDSVVKINEMSVGQCRKLTEEEKVGIYHGICYIADQTVWWSIHDMTGKVAMEVENTRRMPSSDKVLYLDNSIVGYIHHVDRVMHLLKYNVGNCNNQASLTLEILFRNHFLIPAQIYAIRNQDHVFVVLGEIGKPKHLNDPQDRQTMHILDTWARKHFAAKDIYALLKSHSFNAPRFKHIIKPLQNDDLFETTDYSLLDLYKGRFFYDCSNIMINKGIDHKDRKKFLENVRKFDQDQTHPITVIDFILLKIAEYANNNISKIEVDALENCRKIAVNLDIIRNGLEKNQKITDEAYMAIEAIKGIKEMKLLKKIISYANPAAILEKLKSYEHKNASQNEEKPAHKFFTF